MAMDAKMKHNIGLVSGIIVLLADLYWTYLVWPLGFSATPVMLGIVILVFTLVWLWADM